MDKITIYLPSDLKTAVARAARQRKMSESEVIREAIRIAVTPERPQPRAALFVGDPFAERVDELLDRLDKD